MFSSLVAVLCVVFAAGSVQDISKQTHISEGKVTVAGLASASSSSAGFVRTLQFKHRLRVCNAYAFNGPLEIYDGRTKLTNEASMPYKTCRDFLSPLKSGDKLDFKTGEASIGTFSVNELPQNDAVLLLVIHRHDTLSTAIAFESHVFANLANAQVAVLDVYKGNKQSSMRIMDGEENHKDKDGKVIHKPAGTRSEELRYDSVVAVNQGVYEVSLSSSDGELKLKQPLVALNRESYVVLRTGVEAQQGPKFPQALVVYPQSDPAILRSGGKALAAPGLLLMTLLAVVSLAQ